MNHTSLTELCELFAREHNVLIQVLREVNTDSFNITMYSGDLYVKCVLNKPLLLTPTTVLEYLRDTYNQLFGNETYGYYSGLVTEHPRYNMLIQDVSGINDIQRGVGVIQSKKLTSCCSYCRSVDSFISHTCKNCGAPE